MKDSPPAETRTLTHAYGVRSTGTRFCRSPAIHPTLSSKRGGSSTTIIADSTCISCPLFLVVTANTCPFFPTAPPKAPATARHGVPPPLSCGMTIFCFGFPHPGGPSRWWLIASTIDGSVLATLATCSVVSLFTYPLGNQVSSSLISSAKSVCRLGCSSHQPSCYLGRLSATLVLHRIAARKARSVGDGSAETTRDNEVFLESTTNTNIRVSN